ncbi:dCTP deaminase domain-containing protein [Lentisalinibacter salinarum]|uniref:dCTP deaminase domain-containing protein n=1 Tax=Lentisalinibacter salinarum TaxID=2992239 RepID=UPI00386DB327
MRLLTKDELHEKGIIQDGSEIVCKQSPGYRDSTYDATIGTIITPSGERETDRYLLPPRGIVWLISQEQFHLPDNVTGITTLRTTWTKKGLLTLTVGMVDPGYEGPLSTAVINFSNTNFTIEKGDHFFRTVFFEHKGTTAQGAKKTVSGYKSEVLQSRHVFSSSFLNIGSLANEIAPAIFGMPRLAAFVTIIGSGLAVLVALFALILPPVMDIAKGISADEAKLQELEIRMDYLEERLAREIAPSEELKRDSGENIQESTE